MKIDRRTVLAGLGSSLAIPVVLTPGTAEAKLVLTLVKRVRLGAGLGDALNPSLAILSDGNLMAGWISQPAPGTSYVYVRFYDGDGVPISGNIKLKGGATTGIEAESIQLVATDGGKALALFTAKTTGATGPDVTDVYLQKFAANHTASGMPVRVNTTLPNMQDTVRAARLGNGNVLVIWNNGVDGGTDVVGRVVSPNGTMLTDEKVLTNQTAGIQVLSCLTAINGGKAVFTYWSLVDFSKPMRFYAQTLNANGDRVGAPRLIKTAPSLASAFGSVGVFYLPGLGVVYTWYKKAPPAKTAEADADDCVLVWSNGDGSDILETPDEVKLNKDNFSLFPAATLSADGNLALTTISVQSPQKLLVMVFDPVTNKLLAGPQTLQSAEEITQPGMLPGLNSAEQKIFQFYSRSGPSGEMVAYLEIMHLRDGF